MKEQTGILEKFFGFLIRKRLPVIVAIGVISLVMLFFALQVNLKTIFDDLQPQGHPYIEVNNKYKETFGGANVISIMLEIKEGTIFDNKVLGKLMNIQNELVMVEGVNPFQIISLASKKLREIRASNVGIIRVPLMWPDLPEDEEAMLRLRNGVLSNSLIFGRYVSTDLKSLLLTVDFYDQLLDYQVAFKEILKICKAQDGDGVKVRVVGEPILYGWINHYLGETGQIFALTLGVFVLLLLLVERTWRGTFLPILSGLLSGIWALGIATLFKFNADPLTVVVAFLITARCMSHSVQYVTHFDEQIRRGITDRAAAAKKTMLDLFNPGILGVITDGACMIGVMLTPIPLLQKVSIIGVIWVASIMFTVLVLTPLLLSYTKEPKKQFVHPINLDIFIRGILRVAVKAVVTRFRYVLLGATVIIFILSGLYAFNLQIGDPLPGSPILWPDHDYNLDQAAINSNFAGSDRMFVVVQGEQPEALKEYAILENMDQFQRFMESQDRIGGSLSLADVLPTMRLILRGGNPRYKEFGTNNRENSELIYIFVSGSEPGDMDRYSDARYQAGAVTLFFQDHRGDTIRTAIARVKEFNAEHTLEQADYHLAGGLIGIIAAVNEVILAGQIQAIALAMLVVFVCVQITYKSTAAGLFFLIPVMISNTLTFSYMAWKGIGMSTNTLPIVALGIGIGVDYAFYIIDGIREELSETSDLMEGIANALFNAGRGVLVTSFSLIICIGMWNLSTLRFQAEMGMLMAIWLFISAVIAIFVMPAIVYVSRPEFIVGKKSAVV